MKNTVIVTYDKSAIPQHEIHELHEYLERRGYESHAVAIHSPKEPLRLTVLPAAGSLGIVENKECERLSSELIWEWNWRRHHWAHRLALTLSVGGSKITGVHMTFTLNPAQSVPAVLSAVLADGFTPATAVLTALTTSNADNTICVATADPSNPLGVIVNGVSAGSSVLTASATATETDGTVHSVSGAVTIIVPPAGVGVAAALVFTFGSPVTPVPAPGLGRRI